MNHASSRASSCRGRRATAVTIASFVVAGLLGFSCGDGPSSPPPTSDVTLVPAAGPPGTEVRVTGGALVGVSPAELVVTFGGELAPAVLAADGSLRVMVPLFLDDTGWPLPPDEPVDVIFTRGDAILASFSGFTVTALAPSPGTTAAMAEDLAAVSGDLGAIATFLAPDVDLSSQYTLAFIGALDTLVAGNGADALPSLLADLTAGDRELLDALFAAAGVDTTLAALRDGIAGLQAQLDKLGAAEAGLAAARDVSDTWLALRLQLYVIIQGFEQQVLSESASTFATVAGVVGLVRDIPAAMVVQASLTIVDFMLSKVLLSALPAELTAIDLEVDPRVIGFDQLTEATITLHAANHPTPLTLHDVVGLVLTGLGVADAAGGTPGWVSSFENALERVLAFVTGEMQARIAAYAASHPDSEVELDLDLAAVVPQLAWEAAATRRDLLVLSSSVPSVLAPDADVVQWRADHDTPGTAGVWVMPASGPGVVLWPLPPGITYAGGAYGEEMPASPTVDVEVREGFYLRIDFPAVIARGCTETLRIMTHTVASSSAVPLPNIPVEVVIVGGTPDLAIGTTDADAWYACDVTALADATTLTVGVTATDPNTGLRSRRTIQVPVSAPIWAFAPLSRDDENNNYLAICGQYGVGSAGAPEGGIAEYPYACNAVDIDVTAEGVYAASLGTCRFTTAVTGGDHSSTVTFTGTISEAPGGFDRYANSDATFDLLVDSPGPSGSDLTFSWAFAGTAEIGAENLMAEWLANMSWEYHACDDWSDSGTGSAYWNIGVFRASYDGFEHLDNAGGTTTIHVPSGRYIVVLHSQALLSASPGSASCSIAGGWTISR